jgi:hypothetical protein
VEILNLGGASEDKAPAPKSRKKLRVILGIGALAAVTGIGSTLAANISLNGGGNVEFGQGVATTAACDDSITLTPVSTFSNTEEDATFAMTAIQVSGIDLTPEGWDVYNGEWVSGFNPDTHEWSDSMKEHAGQYYNGDTDEWKNTCANKSLMLRAYTDNSDEYYIHTAGWNIATPLLLNGSDYERPLNGNVSGNWDSSNSGVGFRFETYNSGGGHYEDYWDIADNDYNANLSPIYIETDLGGSTNTWDNSTVTIYLDDNNEYPPADSRWVDKLTIESAATTPSGWNSDN